MKYSHDLKDLSEIVQNKLLIISQLQLIEKMYLQIVYLYSLENE